MDLETRKGGCEAQSSFLSEGGRVKMFNGVEGDFPMPDAALVGVGLGGCISRCVGASRGSQCDDDLRTG